MDAKLRIQVLMCVFVSMLLLLTPTNVARTLRDTSERSLISEERHESEKRSSSWSVQVSGGDAVPISAGRHASNYREWVRLQEIVTQDYSTDPVAANPSVPCC